MKEFRSSTAHQVIPVNNLKITYDDTQYYLVASGFKRSTKEVANMVNYSKIENTVHSAKNLLDYIRRNFNNVVIDSVSVMSMHGVSFNIKTKFI